MSDMKYPFILLVIALLTWVPVHAQSGGRITGVITDAQTGELLVGVNVRVDGTFFGAAADADGYYNIMQVPPGTYNLLFTMIGFQPVTVTDVVVRTGLTTTIDVEMAESFTESDQEVVITAERPVIQKDITSSIQYIGSVRLASLPVINATEGLFVQAGVFFDPIPVSGGLGSAGRGERRYSVRGGRQDEVKWFLDGARTATLVAGRADWGGSFTNINMDIIEEVQLMTGGFTAEYGDAQSGIVNVVTRRGGSTLSGSVNYMYGLPGQKHFGKYLYDPSTQPEFLDNTLPDGSLDPAWWTPERQSQIYDYRDVSDHSLNASLGGPFATIAGNQVRFFAATQIRQQAYALPRPRAARNSENYFANLSTGGQGWNLRLNLMADRDAHSTLQENGDFTSQAKYYRGWGSLLYNYTYNASLHFTQILKPNLYYSTKLSYYRVEFREGPSEYTQLGRSANPTLFGFQRYDGFENEPFDQYAPILKNNIGTGDISLNFGLNWQADRNNLIQTGVELRYNEYNERYKYRLSSYSMDERLWLNRGLHEKFNPIQLAGYLQNKMEFDSMILNFGVRYDYFDPNRDWFVPTNYFNTSINPDYDANLDPANTQIDTNGNVKYSFDNAANVPRERHRAYHMISPRFGVSFPMSVNTLLHFNYGHFYQMPAIDQMFEFTYFRPVYIVDQVAADLPQADAESRTPRHIPSSDGDPERVVEYTRSPLKPMKTIQFEVGVKHNFWDFAVLDVTAFYKDVFDQTEERVGLFDRSIRGYDPWRDRINPNQSYASFLSGDYGDSRGFEINLRSLFSRKFNFDANYSFSRSTAGRASPRIVTIGEDGQTSYEWDSDVNKRIPVERSFSRPHILRSTFSYYDRGFNASLMYRFISGQTFTYLLPTDPADTYNNYRYPGNHNLDARLEKTFNFGQRHHMSAYMLVTNVLNIKNLRAYGDILFDADATRQYVEEGRISELDGAGYDMSWQNYFEPRRFYFGVKYGF